VILSADAVLEQGSHLAAVYESLVGAKTGLLDRCATGPPQSAASLGMWFGAKLTRRKRAKTSASERDVMAVERPLQIEDLQILVSPLICINVLQRDL
jgi:hypothetical protein